MAKKRKQRKKAGVCSQAPAPIVNIADRRSQRASIQPRRKESILLAVPTESGYVDFTIAVTFGRAMGSNAVAQCPFRFEIYPEPGKRGIDYARNCIVKYFLNETDCDWLYMIDADERVPENFWELCTVINADIVSGVVPVWVANGPHEAMLRVNNYGVDDKGRCFNLDIEPNMKSPYRVPVLGTGAIAIRRRVFAPEPYGLGDHPFVFTRSEDGKVLAGEDVNFSVRAQKAGFVLTVHPNVVFDHVKSLPIGQIDTYFHARHKMLTEGKILSEEQRLSLG